MNRADIADCFNKLSKKERPIFSEVSPKIFHFLKNNSKSYDRITLDEFITYFKNACKNNYKLVITNFKNMNLDSIDLDEMPKKNR